MAEHRFDIPDGPKLDGIAQQEVTLRELTGVELLDCLSQSEITVTVPVGVDNEGRQQVDYKMLPSPARMAALVLRKRIVCIGEFKAPISDAVWEKLTASDINTMLEESENFDDALMGVTQQGEASSAEPTGSAVSQT